MAHVSGRKIDELCPLNLQAYKRGAKRLGYKTETMHLCPAVCLWMRLFPAFKIVT